MIQPTGPVSRQLRRTCPPGLQPPQALDRVELNPPCSAEAPLAPPRRSLGSRLLRGAGWTAAGLTAGLSALGGIAWVGNGAALREPITVSVHPENVRAPEFPSLCSQLVPAPATPALADSAHGPVELPTFPDSPALGLQIPAATARQLLASPLASQAASAQQQAQGALEKVCVPAGTVRLDVRLPLPTGDRSFLHLGSVDLPSFGERSLRPETLPFSLDYQTAPIATGLRVEVRPVTPDPALKGPGLLLGALEARVSSPSGQLPVEGHVHLKARLPESLRERLGPGQSRLLEEAADHSLDFGAHLETRPGELARTTWHFWAVPDRTGDGRADVVLTQSHDLESLRNLELKLDRLESVGRQPEGWLSGPLHRQVRKTLESQLRSRLPELSEQLAGAAREGASSQLEATRARLESELNRQLSQAYDSSPEVAGQRLGPVQVSPAGLAVGAGPALAAPAESTPVQVGQLAARADLATVNRELAAQTDWQAVLKQAREQSGLQVLEFGRAAEGQPVLPRLAVHQGRLALDADLVVGLGPGQTFRSQVSLPLNLSAKDGKLALQPDGRAARLTPSEQQATNSLLAVLGPRMLSSVLARTELPGTEVGLPAGLLVEGVRVNPESLTLIIRPTEESTQWLLR